MKKFLLTILVAVCALCCALSLVACDNGENGGGQQITEAQWQASIDAFADSDNYAVAMGDNVSKVDGDKLHVIIGANEMMLAKVGDEYYRYVKEGANGQWTKKSITAQQYNEGMSNYKAPIITIAQSFKGDYGSFTYKDGKYTAASIDKTATMGGEVRNVVVTFKNNKLASITFVADLDAPNATYKVDGIGSTNIPLPNVQAPQVTAEVTPEQWQAALSQVQNFTLEFVESDDITQIMYDGISLSVPTGGTKNSIITKDNDNYYVYNFSDDTWVRFASTSDYYTQTVTGTLEVYSTFITMFAEDFDSFPYADGKYTCATLNKIMFGDPDATALNNIEIVFENGALVSIKYETGSGIAVEIKDIHSTTIEIPTEYTDAND